MNKRKWKAECWAEINDSAERQAVMAWVRANNFHSYSEIGNKVYVTATSQADSFLHDSWILEVLQKFEKYPVHQVRVSSL